MDRPRLDSWKDIAAHLGRDVRTVARWERERGLPVHRVPGGGRAHVFAHPEELDAWLAGGHADEVPAAQVPSNPALRRARRLRTWIVLAGGIVLAVLAGDWAVNRTGDPAPGPAVSAVPHRMAVVGDALLAFDAAGRTLWTHPFGGRTPQTLTPPSSYIGDLDGDGRTDMLASLEMNGPTIEQRGGSLFRFGRDGRLAWEATVGDRLTFRGGEYGPPWSAAALAVYAVDGQQRIAWLVHHFTWWPGLLVSFDADGHRLATFVNSGWIRAVAPSPDGRFLLVTGVNNGLRGYFLAVLDARHPDGHSPEPADAPTACLTCPAGSPLSYIVFPRTDVGLAEPFPLGGPSLQTFPDGSVQVQTLENGEPGFGSAIYELSPDLALRQVSFSDLFWERHRRLEGEGVLHHSADACPARRGITVRRWTPGDGWKAIEVPVR